MSRYVLVAGFLFVGFLLGALLGLSAYLPVIGLACLVLAGAVLAKPRVAVWVAAIGALSIAGLVELYLPGFQAIRWVFSLLSLSLVLIAALRYLGSSHPPGSTDPGVARLAVLCMSFVFCTVAAAMSVGMSASDAVVAFKNYFQMWGLICALALFDYSHRQASRFISLLAGLSLIQMPFVLHQYLVLVPKRSSQAAAEHFVVAIDVVAGTFGGSMVGGGRSNDLAILAALAIVFFFARWKFGKAKLSSTLFCSFIAFMPMLFSEAKLSLVLIPFGLFLLFPRAIFERPFAALLGFGGLLGVLVLVVVVYANLPGADAQRSASVQAYVDEALAYNIGNKDYGSGRLNRSTVYSFWWKEHVARGDLKGALFGHGPLQSAPPAAGAKETFASRNFRGYTIGLTGWSTLLWDVGLFGSTAMLAMLSYAWVHARRLLKRCDQGELKPYLATAMVAMPMFMVSMLHSNYIAFDLGFQTMLALFLGFIIAVTPRRQAGKNAIQRNA